MRKIILLFVTGIFIIGCSSDETDCCTIIDTAVSIKYVNGDGENLFDLDNGITVSNITTYHKINNEWVRYYKGNLDNPKGISTAQTEDGTYLIVFPSTTIVENSYTETKIEFSESDFDILRTEVDKRNSNEFVTKVWYNDELKWERNQAERVIEIVK